MLSPGESSMFSARQSRLCLCPASRELMAAIVAVEVEVEVEVAVVDVAVLSVVGTVPAPAEAPPSRATREAAADVLPRSMRSTTPAGKCLDKKRPHWPQTCGWV